MVRSSLAGNRGTTQIVCRRAFASTDHCTDVSPHKLRGFHWTHLASGSVLEGALLASEAGGGELRGGDGTHHGHGAHLHALDPVTVESGCAIAGGVSLSQRSVILGDVAISDGATVAVNASITRDVAPGQPDVGILMRPVGS